MKVSSRCRLAVSAETSTQSGQKSELENSILASGAVVAGGSVTHSVLSQNVRVNEAADVTDCILFDYVNVGNGARLR